MVAFALTGTADIEKQPEKLERLAEAPWPPSPAVHAIKSAAGVITSAAAVF